MTMDLKHFLPFFWSWILGTPLKSVLFGAFIGALMSFLIGNFSGRGQEKQHRYDELFGALIGAVLMLVVRMYFLGDLI